MPFLIAVKNADFPRLFRKELARDAVPERALPARDQNYRVS
jgi:hypothetical protein